MAIPESQLETWARYVPSQISKDTADSIRATLKALESVVRHKDFTVYLQGSYKNDTNLRGDSDVDVVVELQSTFVSNAWTLPPEQNRTYHQTYPDSTYSLADFRRDVIATLEKRYTAAKVDTSGNKAIRVIGNPETRLDADLVVCLEYRKYNYFYSRDSPYVPGIKFYTQRENREVINYPKVHYDNGCAKHQSSRTWFKDTVRTYKHSRNKIVANQWMQPGVAPSYFIECLLHNVPDHRFGGTYQANFLDVLEWLEKADLAGLTCQNEQLPLFVPADVQWSEAEARRVIHELRDLWRLW